MAEVASHTPGTFCWWELATTDQKNAVSFYRALFGWDVNENPMGPNETYSMFQLRGKDVGAAFTMRPEQRQQGVPPHWASYVAVASADDAATRVQELGGQVLAPPFDVFDYGRMAVTQDPTGAVVSVWQPKRHIGAGIVGEPGSVCWTELATRDTKTAEKFYPQLFGWKAKTSGEGAQAYTEFSLDGRSFAGMMAMTEQFPAYGPPHWMPYFAVADVDQTTARAKELGGSTTVPPTDIPNVGRFAVLSDPQGGVFSIITLARR